MSYAAIRTIADYSRSSCRLTGIGGDVWKTAAAEASQSLGITINSYSIGWKQDW